MAKAQRASLELTCGQRVNVTYQTNTRGSNTALFYGWSWQNVPVSKPRNKQVINTQGTTGQNRNVIKLRNTSQKTFHMCRTCNVNRSLNRGGRGGRFKCLLHNHRNHLLFWAFSLSHQCITRNVEVQLPSQDSTVHQHVLTDNSRFMKLLSAKFEYLQNCIKQNFSRN
jgi:hypothetical protein